MNENESELDLSAVVPAASAAPAPAVPPAATAEPPAKPAAEPTTEPADEPTDEPPAAPDDWDAVFARLRARFPKANDRILLCAHLLQQDPDASPEDLKKRANMHGQEPTGASINAARRLLGMDPPRSKRQPRPDRTLDWPEAALAHQFPKEKPGIRYAIYRLRHDPSVTLPDIRDDAEALGIKIGGRSLHSARALLAAASPAPQPASPFGPSAQPAPSAPPAPRPPAPRLLTSRLPAPAASASPGESLEERLRRMVDDVQAQARAENERLRAVFRQVLDLIDGVLDDADDAEALDEEGFDEEGFDDDGFDDEAIDQLG